MNDRPSPNPWPRRLRGLVAAMLVSAVAALGMGTPAVAQPPFWCQYVPPELRPPECQVGGDEGGPAAPAQPASGPGGTDYPHGGMTEAQGGSGSSAWYVFEPTAPRPQFAPVSIMLHGYGETQGHQVMQNMIQHTVRKGYIVIYPRYQTSILEFLWPETMANAVAGVRGALGWLQADPANRVQPQLDKVGYLGHSYGGILAANMANQHASLGLPVPRSLYLYEPHGGQAGNGFDSDMSGVPASTKVNCHVSDTWTAVDLGCHYFIPRISHIPDASKDFVVTYTDSHGSPDLVANHDSICSPPPNTGCYPVIFPDPSRDLAAERRTDAMDFFGHWTPWVALQSCANTGTLCGFALGDTAEHRYMGTWGDGTPVREKAIADQPFTP